MEIVQEQPNLRFIKGAKNYLALPRNPQPWLIKKLVPACGLMNIYADPKAGKSHMALGIANAVSDPTVREFLGHEVVQHGDVLYLMIDTPRDLWAATIDKLDKAGYNLDNVHFTDAMLAPFPFNIIDPNIKETLKKCIEETKPVLLIVDTLREIHEEDEDKSGAMRKVVNACLECTMGTKTAIIFVSHSRKGLLHHGKPMDDNLMGDNRGSSYIPGKMDMIAKLTEKSLILKGRAIGLTKFDISHNEQTHMIEIDSGKAESMANIEYVLGQKQLASERQQAAMLAAMENIEPEAARSRLRAYKKKYGKEESET